MTAIFLLPLVLVAIIGTALFRIIQVLTNYMLWRFAAKLRRAVIIVEENNRSRRYGLAVCWTFLSLTILMSPADIHRWTLGHFLEVGVLAGLLYYWETQPQKEHFPT